jgi:hypothetical protein
MSLQIKESIQMYLMSSCDSDHYLLVGKSEIELVGTQAV